MNTFRKKAVTVFVNSDNKEERYQIPPIVHGGFQAPSMGNTIPLLVITDPEYAAIWAKLPYKQINERNLKKLRSTVTKYQKGELEPQPDTESIPIWPSKKGGSWKGHFEELNANALVIKNKAGTNLIIKRERLSKEALSYAKAMGNQSNPSTPASDLTPTEWTSSEGKTIQATFVALAGDTITLKLSSGKNSTFPLARLSEESQAQARELAQN